MLINKLIVLFILTFPISLFSQIQFSSELEGGYDKNPFGIQGYEGSSYANYGLGANYSLDSIPLTLGLKTSFMNYANYSDKNNLNGIFAIEYSPVINFLGEEPLSFGANVSNRNYSNTNYSLYNFWQYNFQILKAYTIYGVDCNFGLNFKYLNLVNINNVSYFDNSFIINLNKSFESKTTVNLNINNAIKRFDNNSSLTNGTTTTPNQKIKDMMKQWRNRGGGSQTNGDLPPLDQTAQAQFGANSNRFELNFSIAQSIGEKSGLSLNYSNAIVYNKNYDSVKNIGFYNESMIYEDGYSYDFSGLSLKFTQFWGDNFKLQLSQSYNKKNYPLPIAVYENNLKGSRSLRIDDFLFSNLYCETFFENLLLENLNINAYSNIGFNSNKSNSSIYTFSGITANLGIIINY